MPVPTRSTPAAFSSLPSNWRWTSCLPSSAKFSSPTKSKGSASRKSPPAPALGRTRCYPANVTQCSICASDCKVFTTTLRKREEPNMARRLLKMLFIIPLAIVGMLLFVFIGGEIVLHLWNWLLPSLFGWREITFWQAVGLLALCRILFAGFGWHRPPRYNFPQLLDYRRRPATP